MISYRDAQYLLSKRPDIITSFRAWGWSEAELQDYVRVATEWWKITTEKDAWGGDIQNYVNYLRSLDLPPPPPPELGIVTYEEAALIIANRPDILPFYQGYGWDISESNWVAIVTNWWSITTEKDKWQGDIQNYIAWLRGEPTPPGPPEPSEPGLSRLSVPLVLAALVLYMATTG